MHDCLDAVKLVQLADTCELHDRQALDLVACYLNIVLSKTYSKTAPLFWTRLGYRVDPRRVASSRWTTGCFSLGMSHLSPTHHGQSGISEENMGVVLQLVVSLQRSKLFGDAGTGYFVSASMNVLSMPLVRSSSLTVGWWHWKHILGQVEIQRHI